MSVKDLSFLFWKGKTEFNFQFLNDMRIIFAFRKKGEMNVPPTQRREDVFLLTVHSKRTIVNGI